MSSDLQQATAPAGSGEVSPVPVTGLSPRAEALLNKVQGMLNEEQWTRATLNNYTTAQFQELDVLLGEAREAGALEALRDLCEEHLDHNKHSIIALYLAGVVSISRQIIEDSALVNLMDIFEEHHKWNIVRYLCEGALEFGESKSALRTLADCCKNDGDEEALYGKGGVWERIVRVDYEEADLAKALAEQREKSGDLESAVEFYKKALHRYISKGFFSSIREIWEKLLQFCLDEKNPFDDLDFFFNVHKRVAKSVSPEKASQLLRGVYELCLMRDDLDTAIVVLKIILEYDNDDKQARRDITECFKKKYKNHSQLDTCIRVSSLASGPRNVKEAVADFEKHIAFDQGNYVYHRSWGVGRIAGIQGDDITIDFAKKRGHTMSVKMAVEALQTLSKDHIWVLKATWKPEKLREKVKNDLPWALKTVIKSFDNSCDLKRIKAELVPAALSPGEWIAWSNKARDLLKTDPSFGVSPDDIDLFTVRDRPMSMEEKLYSEFKAERDFFGRAATIRAFVIQKEAEIDSEYFSEMFGYFTAYLKSSGQVNEQVVASYLLVKDLVGAFPHLGMGVPLSFTDIYQGITDLPELFVNLKDQKMKEDFLRQIQLFIPGWQEIFLSLFPRSPLGLIVVSLEKVGYSGRLTSLALSCFDKYREYREAVIWLYRNAVNAPWFEAAGIPQDKRLITLIPIMDLSSRDIENRRDISENRKLNKQVSTILFKEDALGAFLDEADQDTVTRIYTFIDDVKSFDPSDKVELQKRIRKRYPDFKFTIGEEKKAATLGLIVTQEKYVEKQKQLDRIKNVDLPANAKELEFAMSLGDLRENAEYKAAKEKQTLLNSELGKLNGEIGRAQIFDPAKVNTSRVSFGTKVTLRNQTEGKTEVYTILGPWESDPAKGIISYLTPLGGSALDKAVGDTFTRAVEDKKITYQVKAIDRAL